MTLTKENYHGEEANQEYLSNSQYKDFAGCQGHRGCEAMALAKLRGEWAQEDSEALLIGGYVDAHVEGTLEEWKARHSEDVFKKKGGVYAWVEKSDAMISRFERDPLFMKFLEGQKQVIMTAEFFGAKWKVKIDCLGADFISDLKTTRSITKTTYSAEHGCRICFADEWGYDFQSAIYQKVVQLNLKTEKPFPVFFPVVSKEDYPDIDVIYMETDKIRAAMDEIERNVPRILSLKRGEVEPDRCEICDYCRSTKVLKKPRMSSEIVTALT